MAELTLQSAGSVFGKSVKAKFSSPVAEGHPEDQLRAPVERLVADLAVVGGLPKGDVTLVGESSLHKLRARPDYAITVRDALCGFLELKSPGKGADPRSFTGHDKSQWEKLRSLPNLVYTDGNEWSLWRYGELAGDTIRLVGDVRTAGAKLKIPARLVALLSSFLHWKPTPPADAQQLARVTAKLCKLLREEVTEQLAAKNPALTSLAGEWRKLLFPEATDEAFADGYAQAVTFGLLLARARGVKLGNGLERVASQLRKTNSLIGTALRLLTDDAESQRTLATSLQTLIRVLDAVSWTQVAKGGTEAWLYFYEDFLAEYDNDLRKRTGSYYTPPGVVTAMVRLVHEALVTRFGQPEGLASQRVTIADPAVGTGTFPLGVLRCIAETIREEQGDGAVAGAIEQAIGRLIAFEIQLGPFAVAQVRMTGEVQKLTGGLPSAPLRMYVTDTLGNPYVEMEELSTLTKAIAESRRMANEIKKNERITVVIGNPPYKEKAKGRGGWIESGGSGHGAPLAAWMPPAEWGVGAHSKHLRNLYIYFWRWATWKVFDQDQAGGGTGIVCFITVAGFLNGPGFQKMRDYLRRTGSDIWVIDCSPEGHQPKVNTRVFQAVQQPVCIVLVARANSQSGEEPATVRYRQLPAGHRDDKFSALAKIRLDDPGWTTCPTDWREPFLPESEGEWASFVPLEDLFLYNGSGVMPGRTWIIAPDSESLRYRWDALIQAPAEEKEELFRPHLRGGKPGDKHTKKVVKQGLGRSPGNRTKIADELGACTEPICYGYRSFDRQWIIPDARLINQPNPNLWETHSERQVYLTVLTRSAPRSGPALTVTGLIPDLDHYKGSFGGRVFPLWSDVKGEIPNLSPGLLDVLSERYGRSVTCEDAMAYIAGTAAHPAFTSRFCGELTKPGLRIPLTADNALFERAVAIGREVIWLHTFGDRFADPATGRKPGPPRLPKAASPRIPADGAIPGDAPDFPDELRYDEGAQALHVGRGRVERVTPEMWSYEVSGKHVITQWFSYRKRYRTRPIIGDRRPPSSLKNIQPDGWLSEYTTELLNVLHVLGRLTALEPTQADLLEQICDGPMLSADALDRIRAANTAELAERRAAKKTLFDD